jgi:serine/threonine-protein kinase
LDSQYTPRQLGRYKIIAPVASGGMADVYAARAETGDPATGRGAGEIVAIKVMREELLEEDRFVAMFFDEAQLAAQINSQNVVKILDLGRDERGVPYIAMELIIGASVMELMKGNQPMRGPVDPMPLHIALEIIAQVGLGMQDAHDACDALGTPLEIVHRDVSPQNILVGLDGRARLTDFGVARATARLTRTETGEVKGKTRYFSPEQAVGRTVDSRSDIFALGIVFWEMLSARPLFNGKSMAEVLSAVTQKPIPSVRERRPDVPEAIAHVIARALERDLNRRFQHSREFAAALREAAASSGIGPVPVAELAAYIHSRSGASVERMQRATGLFTPGSGERAAVSFDDADEESTTVDTDFAAAILAARAQRSAPLRAPAGPTIPGAFSPHGIALPTTQPNAAPLAPPPPPVQSLPIVPPSAPRGAVTCMRCGAFVAESTTTFSQDGLIVCNNCATRQIQAPVASPPLGVLALGYSVLALSLLSLVWNPYMVFSVLTLLTASGYFAAVLLGSGIRARLGRQFIPATASAALGTLIALSLIALRVIGLLLTTFVQA